jgi:hypothetical protein
MPHTIAFVLVVNNGAAAAAVPFTATTFGKIPPLGSSGVFGLSESSETDLLRVTYRWIIFPRILLL